MLAGWSEEKGPRSTADSPTRLAQTASPHQHVEARVVQSAGTWALQERVSREMRATLEEALPWIDSPRVPVDVLHHVAVVVASTPGWGSSAPHVFQKVVGSTCEAYRVAAVWAPDSRSEHLLEGEADNEEPPLSLETACRVLLEARKAAEIHQLHAQSAEHAGPDICARNPAKPEQPHPPRDRSQHK